jgi:hypothetical protein
MMKMDEKDIESCFCANKGIMTTLTSHVHDVKYKERVKTRKP